MRAEPTGSPPNQTTAQSVSGSNKIPAIWITNRTSPSFLFKTVSRNKHIWLWNCISVPFNCHQVVQSYLFLNVADAVTSNRGIYYKLRVTVFTLSTVVVTKANRWYQYIPLHWHRIMCWSSLRCSSSMTSRTASVTYLHLVFLNTCQSRDWTSCRN